MGEAPQPRTGRPKKDLEGEIQELLESTDQRAMTLGMITDEVNGARATVKDRLENLLSDPGCEIQSQKIGNATAYWIPEEKVGSLFGAVIDPFQRFKRAYLIRGLGIFTSYDDESNLRWLLESRYAGSLGLFITMAILFLASYATMGLLPAFVVVVVAGIGLMVGWKIGEQA